MVLSVLQCLWKWFWNTVKRIVNIWTAAKWTITGNPSSAGAPTVTCPTLSLPRRRPSRRTRGTLVTWPMSPFMNLVRYRIKSIIHVCVILYSFFRNQQESWREHKRKGKEIFFRVRYWHSQAALWALQSGLWDVWIQPRWVLQTFQKIIVKTVQLLNIR